MEKFEKEIEKARVEKFLKHLMIENQGLYTLMGTKPMTFFSLVPIIDKGEKKEIYRPKTEKFKQSIPFIKFKLNSQDCRKLWEDWKQIQDQYIGKQFRIIEYDNEGIFLNIPEALFILDKWYRDFARITGIEFNPFEAVYEIGDPNSLFWKKIQRNHFLLGLLLGYGEKNAKYFEWEKEKKFQFPLRRGTGILPCHSGKPADKLSLEDLELPRFIIYQIVDKEIENYKIERDNYIKLYEGKDFVTFTLELLRGVSPKEKEKVLSDESKQLIQEWVGYNSTIR